MDLRRAGSPSFEEALQSVQKTESFTRTELERVLAATDHHEAELLFSAARAARTEYFGNRVFLYGFVYFSTYCRNQCTFCLYRRSNVDSPRYRKSAEEAVEIAKRLADSGVHLVDLTMGEDPLLFESDCFDPLVDMVRAVKRETGCAVMVSPGVVGRRVLADIRRAGADWYACYQETHNRSLYRRLRPSQDYDRRAVSRLHAMGLGMLAEDGMLVGVGESTADRATSVMEMWREGVQQVRVMGFVPQPGTPLARRPRPSHLDELVTLAVLRLVMPERLIPASLDVDGLGGLADRLWAGANVVTSIIPPAAGLAGVSNHELDIEAGGRTAESVRKCLGELGLVSASAAEYATWLERSSRDALLEVGSL